MKDLPLFTTPNGVATIILRNVPYTRTAYIRLCDAVAPGEFIKECCDFCRAVGAERVFATGHELLSQYDLHTRILKMQRDNNLPETDAAVLPVQAETMEQWREIYNEKMATVPTAAMISFHEAKKYLAEGNCYFVHQGDTLLGIGVVSENRIDAIASIVPGEGRRVLSALSKALLSDTIELYVAENNLPAMKLYQSLDFVTTGVVEQWHKIF